jgi:hypothetical protein
MKIDHLERIKKGVYKPIVKGKGFNPNPLAGNIPAYADSESNPSCIHTEAYRQFWEEQIHRCIHGYDTGGIHIPGLYYFFLNFTVIKGLGADTYIYPYVTDFDLEYCSAIEYARNEHKAGIITPKSRRKGLTELAQNVHRHGAAFIPGYLGAVATGDESYLKVFKTKLMTSLDNVVPEFRLAYAKKDPLEFGFYAKKKNEAFQKKGFGGSVRFETLSDNPNKLEGEYFHVCDIEEAGNFKAMGEAYFSIEPAMKQGALYRGIFLIYGTGDNILSTSKDFREFYEDAETLNLIKFWVPASRKHFPFFKCRDVEEIFDPLTGEKVDPLVNLRQQYLPEQMIGMEDILAADEFIGKEKKRLSKLKNKKRYKEYCQEHPQTLNEVWIAGGSNSFDDDLLFEQLNNIYKSEELPRAYILDFVKIQNEDGDWMPEIPLRVTSRPAKEKDLDDYKVMVMEKPNHEYTDLDVMGIDSYNQDQSNNSNSLGAGYVLRNYSAIKESPINGRKVVCGYYKRPRRKEIFFEQCLKIAVWYDLVGNTMCSAEQELIIDYFKKHHGRRYLAPRPKRFDAKDARPTHDYGAKMTGYSKPLAIGLGQSFVLDSIEYCFYEEIIRDFLAYDELTINSDWDSVDAIMLAEMRYEDMKRKARKKDGDEGYKYNRTEWVKDSRGNLYPVTPEKKKSKKEESKKQEPQQWVDASPTYNPDKYRKNL